MFYFWSEEGIYEQVGTLGKIISHLRNLGGDREGWKIMGATNEGLVEVPILDLWFE